MKKLVVLFGISLILVFTGCIGIESTMKIELNGSGTLVLQYKISQLLVNMGQTEEEEGKKQAPLPLSEEEFRQAIQKTPGLTLISVKQEETESDVIIRAEIAFNNVSNLAKSEIFKQMPITFRQSGNNFIFTQLITEANEEMTEEQVQTMESFFQGYEMAFIITAPRKIINHNRGSLSEDERTLTYRITMMELMQLRERTELSLTW
jgi:hypothetical protein